MKREIKFRAAYKTLNTVYEVSEIMWSDQTVCLINSRGDQRLESLDDVDLLQFTGLKDKNGKEIYEGDILKVKSGNRTATTHEVKYRDGVFEDSLIPLCSLILPNDTLGRVTCQVIGNIYENPALLQ